MGLASASAARWERSGCGLAPLLQMNHPLRKMINQSTTSPDTREAVVSTPPSGSDPPRLGLIPSVGAEPVLSDAPGLNPDAPPSAA